jgi:hypothetical protein
MSTYFLLGGYDLEMLEIKKLLEQHGYPYYDKQLKWGAKLSEYKEYFNDHDTFIAIELEEDIKSPKNYKLIDHHNANSHKKSSLKQVAEYLHVKLNRWQQLVSANDSFYIAGMQNINASEDEILSIRQAEKEIQGVTKEDEILAHESVKKSGNSHIIRALTPKFSVISDIVYCKFKQYIIYNTHTALFYGYKIERVKTFLNRQNLSKDDYYYGGGDYGFLGIKDNILHVREIEKLIEEFILMQKEVISHHTFMLPFIFDYEKDKKYITKGWEFKEYQKEYNEIAYFHSFFQESMFTSIEDANSSFYTKKEYKNSKFIISKSKEYNLTLKSLNLRLFKTGVGILSFHIENREYIAIKDILEINDYGRRIYPEYLKEDLTCTLIPEFIQLDTIREDFKYETKPEDTKLSKIITEFLPQDKIRPAVDDRMFVISFYKNSKFSDDLKTDYKTNDKWYEYIFIDGNGLNVQNTEMQKELVEQSTYARWQNNGTMYGVSRYSFVCLADSSFALEHMKTIYFQMFSLLLMLRATILKFSADVSTIAQDIDNKNTAQNVSDLYKRYIQFVNNFYFREITAKDQGIELYEKAIKLLNIERDIKDLDREIEELHKFVELENDKIRAKEMDNLSKLGYIFLPGTLIAGLFGMNTFKGLDNIYGFILSISLIVFSTWYLSKIHNINFIDFLKGKK